MSAFTVTTPATGSSTLRFTLAITNIGDDYNTTTGKFTCHFPGIYAFALHILIERGADYAGCYIRKNKSDLIEAHSNPNTDYGFFSSSASVVVHLTRGDEMDVYCRSGEGSVRLDYTSFSGFLNKAD